jgi:hypothetical protein
MKFLKHLLVITLTFPLSGCQKDTIPEGIYRTDIEEGSYEETWFTVNGRKAKIDEIKSNNDLIIVCLSVEHNKTIKKVKRGYRYSVNLNQPKSTIRLYGSSNSTLFLTLALDYKWEFNEGTIIQKDKKGNTLTTYKLPDTPTKSVMELTSLLKQEEHDVFTQSKEVEGASYRLLLAQAMNKTPEALIKLTQLRFVGDAGEEHNKVLLNLLTIWGDKNFSKTIASLTPEEKSTLKAMLNHSSKLWEKEFPLTLKVLNQKEQP